MEDWNKTKGELISENIKLKTRLKEVEIQLKKEKLNAINWEQIAKSLLDNPPRVGGKTPKEEKIMEIIAYRNGTIRLIVNNKERKVTSIQFNASVNEIPVLKTEEFIVSIL